MPSVNTFGGCDPYVEFRIVQGQDPLKNKSGNVSEIVSPELVAKTESVEGTQSPEWGEKLELKMVPVRKDCFVHVVLWDKNMISDMPIGHQTFLVDKLLEGLAFVASETIQKKRPQKMSFKSLLDSGEKLKASVQTKFSYVEMVKFHFTVVKGSRFPKVKILGTIDGFVELRVETQDPRKKDFETRPTSSCLWSAKTSVIQDNMDPKFNQEFDIILPAYAYLILQVIIWDSNSPLPDSPICQSVLELKEVTGRSPSAEPTEHRLKAFKNPPGVGLVADVKNTRVAMKIGACQVLDEAA